MHSPSSFRGAPKGANPESSSADGPDFAGFRARSLRSRPGMTIVECFGLKKPEATGKERAGLAPRRFAAGRV